VWCGLVVLAMTSYGQVTGTDLADEVLARAEQSVPEAKFVAGDFMSLDLGLAHYDVAISLEVLSRVADQQAFVGRIAELLKPEGLLMLATQNKPALLRNDIPHQGMDSFGTGWTVKNRSNCWRHNFSLSACFPLRPNSIEARCAL
jgi:2-polyprenyl-3-methyl-5-hydroxy-6-metoxy-1,4-benzoquinol methylase